LHQNRLLEAESATRLALLDQLSKRGRYSSETAQSLTVLANVMIEEGRPKDAEALSRAAIDIYQRLGSGEDSYVLGAARAGLARILMQQRYEEAGREFDKVRQSMQGDPEAISSLVDGNLAYVIVSIHLGRKQEALRDAKLVYKRRQQALGDKHYDAAEAAGFYGAALALNGDRRGALAAFQAAAPILLSSSRASEDDQSSIEGRQRRLRFILESYLRLLWSDRAAIGADKAAAEAFRIADAVRGQSVQRALAASAARAAVRDPHLGDLIRQEQDSEHQIAAINGLLADALSMPTQQQDQTAIQKMRVAVDRLRDTRATIRAEIEQRFPDYVSLIDPQPMTPSQAQALLRPGQALIVSYVAEERSYVWAMRPQGALTFAEVSLGASELAGQVAALRHSLDPRARSLADIPAFDVEVANQIYAEFVQPVEAGWRGAGDLLVVAHGSLAELPLALLVTSPVG
jgi:hypothetical protein